MAMKKTLNFKNLLSEYSEYSDFCAALKSGKTPISLAGIVESCLGQFIYGSTDDKKTLVITYSDQEAKQLVFDLELYTDNVRLYPAKEYVFFEIDAQNRHSENMRLEALLNMQKNGGITVTSLEALLQFTIPPKTLAENTLNIKLGDMVDPEKLSEKLIKMGYIREEEVSGKGQFSLRGGILDVFSPQEENPCRIEFFDIEIDSIRNFDTMTQRSFGNVEETCIIPCRELSEYDRDDLISKLEDEIKKLKRKKSDQSKAIENIESDIEKLAQGVELSSISRYIGVVYDEIPTLLDYI
ncbi:MAG: hypothetical protein IKY39_05705, partial [Clostridia bacterium]|nr:hypothetical protein [Clostridia bacterium]